MDPPVRAGAASARLTPQGRCPARGRLLAPLDWGLLRAPLLPVDAYAPADGAEPADPRVRAALAVASPDLLDALSRPPRDAKQADAIRLRVERYARRMATRPTPFGLFAGVALIGWGPSTGVEIEAGRPRTRTRPDMGWLSGLVARLEGEPAIRRELRLMANPGLLIRAGRVFAAAPAPDISGAVPPAASVRATPVVRRLLELARRPVPHDQLTAAVVDVTGAPEERAERLVTGLWKNAILFTDLRPPLTGTAPGRYVRDRLRDVPAAAEVVQDLDALLAHLDEIDELALDRMPAALATLRSRLEKLHPVTAGTTGLQVDTALPLRGATLSASVPAEAADAAELLLRISPMPARDPALARYRAAFHERYGTQRTVPLLELMDPDLGLGPPGERAPGAGSDEDEMARRRDAVLEQLALRADRERLTAVDLDDELALRLQTWDPDTDGVPSSLDISVLVAAASASALDDGEFTLVVSPNVGGVSAGSMAGRFADLLGSEAVDALRRTARVEADGAPGVVSAELVYAPGEPSLANLAIRPATRSHEVALGTMPGVPWDRVVGLADLMVVLSGERFHITWPAAGTEVVVSQGHMLNLAYAPPAARFLVDVGRDGLGRLAPFSWGAAARFPRLPRIRRGRVVLSPARWRLAASGLVGSLSMDEFGDRVSAWCATHGVPRHVYLGELDNRLLLDLGDSAGLALLQDELRRHGREDGVVLQEALPGPGDAWLEGPHGGHLAELVVPLVKRRRGDRSDGHVRRRGAPPPADRSDGHIRRRGATPPADRLRPPGSDWLYLKLYCPGAAHEELITGPVQAMARFAVAAGLCDRWFFVRYRDPEPHLRIRFHGRPDDLIGRLLARVTAWAGDLVSADVAQRFSFDTYERESERYGGQLGMSVAEAVFAADSAAVADLLAIAPDPAPDRRVALAMRGLDALLEDLGLSDPERRRWYDQHAPLSKEDGRIYRARRNELCEFLERSRRPDDPIDAVLDRRRTALRSLAPDLQAARAQHGLTPTGGEICRSHVHMHCNRLLELGSPLEPVALALARRARESLAHVRG